MSSYTTLNQIFYKHNKFDTPESIIGLESYFLTHTKKEELFYKESNTVNVSVSNENTENENTNEHKLLEPEPEPTIQYIQPKQGDSLFWCIYIFKHGYNDYLQIHHSYGNRELEEKHKMIEFFKKTPRILKETNQKITIGMIDEILSEFMIMQNTTTFMGLIAICIYYNICIYVVDQKKKIYIKFVPKKLSETSTESHEFDCILYKDESCKLKGKYKISNNTSPSEFEKIQNEMICLEQYSKPLRPSSCYKMTDLEDMANKLNIWEESESLSLDNHESSNKKKWKKPDLYNKLFQYCTWN